MATYLQQDRPIQLTTVLGPDKLLVHGLTGAEAVSRPFRFTLDLFSEDPAIDGADLLRTAGTITLALAGGGTREIHGWFNRFVQLGQHDDVIRYRAELVPRLWFAGLARDCRIYQNKTVPEILEEVLKKHDVDYSLKCTAQYPQREYCVQYRESDLDFISRLMEEEGIFYLFDHGGEREVLLIADASNAVPACPEQDSVRMSLEPQEDEDVVLGLYREQAVHTSKVTLKSYDYLQPPMSLSPSVDSVDSGFGEEIYDFPGDYTTDDDGYRQARLRIEAEEAKQQVVQGRSDCRAFVSGTRFKLQDHFNADLNGEYILTEVQHRADAGGYRAGTHSGFSYENEFQAIPTSIPYRPPRVTPAPTVYGTQTAVVVGPAGEEVYTDRHGRVKVQFHWDREGSKDENSSCWIRVAQPWAGKGYGTAHIPRIGNEVVVQFLDGDANRPIIIGSVYNADQVPPFELPGQGIQQGIKSRSSKGGGGANEISVWDDKGAEELRIHAQTDENHTVGRDQQMTVDGDRTVHVKGAVDETIDAGETRNVTDGIKETVTGDVKQTITGKLEQTVTGGIKVTTPADIQMTAAAGVKIVAPAGINVIAPGGHTQVDNFWDQTGLKKYTAYAQAIAVTGQITATFAQRFQVAGWDTQLTAFKVSTTGMYIDNKVINLEKDVTTIKQKAVALITCGLYSIT